MNNIYCNSLTCIQYFFAISQKKFLALQERQVHYNEDNVKEKMQKMQGDVKKDISKQRHSIEYIISSDGKQNYSKYS